MSATDACGVGAPMTAPDRAELAFAVHQSLQKAACDNPGLTRNPYWQVLQETAFCRFLAEFEDL